MFIAVLLVVLFRVEPPTTGLKDHVDLMELNHCLDDYGKPRFTQIIFWEWDKDNKHLVSQGFYMMKDELVFTQIGQTDWVRYREMLLKPFNPMQRAHLWQHLEYAGEYGGHPSHPMRDFRKKLWVANLRKDNQTRVVTSKSFRETTTYYDPEADDRKFFPDFERRKLEALKH